MDADADVVIAGAGPAGIAAAVAVARRRPDLAERGRIICFDKARFPREKPCGGGLTGHARTALYDLGLRVRVPAVPCGVGRIVYGGLVRTVRLETPVDVIRREEFDADLIAQARMIGVVVNEDEGIASHEVDETRGLVGVATSRGRRLNSRVLVAADGAGSRIRRQLLAGNNPRASMPSLPERSLPLRLFKHEIPAPPGFPAEMVYDFSPMDDGLRGYVWMFPVAGGRVNVGAMHTPSRRMSGRAVVEVLERTLARHGISLPPAHTGMAGLAVCGGSASVWSPRSVGGRRGRHRCPDGRRDRGRPRTRSHRRHVHQPRLGIRGLLIFGLCPDAATGDGGSRACAR